MSDRIVRAPRPIDPAQRTVHVEFLHDTGSDPYRSGMVDVRMDGERVCVDAPNGVSFRGTWGEFLAVFEGAFRVAELNRLTADAMREVDAVAELRSQLQRLRWIGDGRVAMLRCPRCKALAGEGESV